jgi:hypothetical protein
MANAEINGYSVDEVSKIMATGAIGAYVIGYIVLSFHFGRLGFSQSSPLRPRVLETGVAATLFVAVPLLIGIAVGKMSNRGIPTKFAIILRLCFLTYLCDVAVCIPGFTIDIPSSFELALSGFASFGIAVAVLAVVGFIFVSMGWVWRNYHKRQLASVITFLVVSIVVVANRVYFRYDQQLRFMIWFFVISSVACIRVGSSTDLSARLLMLSDEELEERHYKLVKDIQKDTSIWQLRTFIKFYMPITFFSAAMIILVAYVYCIYDYIPFRLGGGQVLSVTLYIKNKDQSTSLLRAGLLDESDHGFYLLLPGNTKGTFISRDKVDAIYFAADKLDKLPGIN